MLSHPRGLADYLGVDIPDAITTPSLCQCGAEIFRTGPKGPTPKYCKQPACVRQRAAEATRRFRGTYIGDVELECADCSKRFPRPGSKGRLPQCCPECTTVRFKNRKAAEQRARTVRRREPDVPVQCGDCPATFDRPSRNGPIPKRCPECAALRFRAMSRVYQRDVAAQRYQRRGRWSVCQDCSAKISCARKGPRRKWCDTCLPGHVRDYIAARAAPIRARVSCLDCGGDVRLIRKGYGRRRCTLCSQKRQKQQIARWPATHPEKAKAARTRSSQWRRAIKRGATAERFNPVEIYARDNWRCQICRRHVNRALKYPDPKSASLDHVIPLSQGGSHTRANSRLAHLSCNVARSNRGGNEQLALI